MQMNDKAIGQLSGLAGRLVAEGLISADDAVFAEEVDAERARSELAEAEEKLEGLSSYDAEFADIDAERRWAQARIDAAGTPH